MKVFLAANMDKEKTALIMPKVLERLKKNNITVSENETDISNVDIVITVGGDGTILRWGKIAARAGKPLLGINTGTLGFMATLEHNELYRLDKLVNCEYRISERIILEVCFSDCSILAINDLVFKGGEGVKLSKFLVSAGGVDVFRISADGLIFSTPTGSTAYALSAGGPILEPELSCIEFTPLSAHTLFGRSMIFTAEKTISVSYENRPCNMVFISADGNQAIPIQPHERVEIRKSDIPLKLIDMERNSFYNAVHDKLMRPLK